jgi:hypothetical protein
MTNAESFRVTKNSYVKLDKKFDEILALVQRFNIQTDDRRKNGGRFWVLLDNKQSIEALQFQQLGFVYAESRRAWYWPEE